MLANETPLQGPGLLLLNLPTLQPIDRVPNIRAVRAGALPGPVFRIPLSSAGIGVPPGPPGKSARGLLGADAQPIPRASSGGRGKPLRE